MSIRIHIPANLREFAGGLTTVEVDAGHVGEALNQLSSSYPCIHDRLLSIDGQLHSFVNIFVDGQSIRDLEGLNTKLGEGGALLIVPALAGG